MAEERIQAILAGGEKLDVFRTDEVLQEPDVEAPFVVVRRGGRPAGRRFRLVRNQHDPRLLFTVAEEKPFSCSITFWFRLEADGLLRYVRTERK